MNNNITIGSDPEFIIYDTKEERMIEAYEFFKDNKFKCKHAYRNHCIKNFRNCKVQNNFCGHFIRSPAIGSDGSLGELRPIQSYSPIGHVDNIQSLLGDLKKVIAEHIILKAGTVQK